MTQSYHCNTACIAFKRFDHFSKHQSNCTEIIPPFISSVLNSTNTGFEALSINKTTNFKALSISNSSSFIKDHIVPEITFEENQAENDNNDRKFENGNNDRQFENDNDDHFEDDNNDSQFENDNNDSQFENDNNGSQFESTNSSNMSILCSNVSVNTSRDWKTYREAKEKTRDTESIIQSLSSLVKHTNKKNLANSVLAEVIIYTDSENIHEAAVVGSIITYIKELNKKGQ